MVEPPFQHPGNWYHAFHGTGRAAAFAAKSIVTGGFNESAGGACGPGVYVSPCVTYCENGYCGFLNLDMIGNREFKCVLLVAVRPQSIRREGVPESGVGGSGSGCEAIRFADQGLLNIQTS